MKRFKTGSLEDLKKIKRRLVKSYERGELSAEEGTLVSNAICNLETQINNTN